MSANTDLTHLPEGIKDKCRSCGEPWLNFADRREANGKWTRTFHFEYDTCPECRFSGKVSNPSADLLHTKPADQWEAEWQEENQREENQQ